MKSLIVLACAFVAANAISKGVIEQFVNQVKDIGGKCIGETNAKPDDIGSLLSHKIPDSHEGKCLLFCIHKGFNFQNADGSLNGQGALKMLDPLKEDDPEAYEKLRNIAITCGAKVTIDSDPCQTASNIAQCVFDEAKANGFSSDMFEI
ncbi:general odorant-binding protein 19d-like [Aethina tumida]|uniref:Odorant-binding protein 2 n=1 Tax=Aethina tumida TaxID=116153 RepID=A0A6M3VXI4_AETTU|nr:general odorant-binding protein 19d-like [Aethina tumida]QJF45547.1 odorant-binding protein 2 [Aethina tumida]